MKRISPSKKSTAKKSEITTDSVTASSKKGATKKQQLIELLQHQSGISLSELIKKSGWQAHSIRGFISGTLRKQLKLNVVSEITPNGTRKYKIASEV